MKLISCYIENFGGLSKYALDFDAGLTVIRQPNGFGKTTLAEFIRAMFYGFPRKTRTLGKRQKYRPWNGKKCCGHLTFEHEGRQYRIERTFGATPRGDSFNLIDLQTGQKSGRFSEEIGLELFGLDADSFERSTYLPQNRETGPLTTDSIRAKLGGLVEDESDVGNFEKAMKTLHDKRSSYIPYKNAANAGAVAEAAAEITRVQQALDRAEGCTGQLTETSARITQLEAEQKELEGAIEQVRADLSVANEAAARQARRQEYGRMKTEREQTAAELDALRKKYPGTLPDRGALEKISGAVDRMAQLEAAQVVTDTDQSAQRYVTEHEARFAAGIPTEEEFAAMRQVCDDCRGVVAQLETCALSREDEAELTGLRKFFAPGVPEEEEIRSHEAALEQADRLRRENLRLAAQTTVEEPKYKVSSPLTVPLLLGGGVIAAVVGIVLLVQSQLVPGGVVLALGVLALLVGGCLSLRNTQTCQVPGMNPQIQTLIREKEAQADALEAPVKAYVARYSQASPAEGLRQIRERAVRLVSLGQRELRLKEQYEALMARREEYNAVLREFFEKYYPAGITGNGYDLLARLQRESDTWVRALGQLEDRDARLERHRRETEAVQQTLNAFGETYGLAPQSREQVLAIRDDVRRMAELAQTVSATERRMEAYFREHADVLNGPEATVQENPVQLRSRERQLQEKQRQIDGMLPQLRQRERLLREEVDRAPELRDELAAWQERKAARQNRAAILDDTMDFLAKAKDDLALAYMGPIRESFSGLLERMMGEEKDKILVTPELEVRLERAGESRELAYFSAGQADLVMLCMRLALVDALFREAKPFVILDDPFVNLDDERTAEALKLLKDLSRDRQIIYLVCNSSRV